MKHVRIAAVFTTRKSTFLQVLSIVLLLNACSPTRHLEEGEQLLTRVKIESSSTNKYTSDLKSLPKQQPNKKLLGLFKLYLGIYNLYYNKPDSKIRQKIGEPPVVYDSSSIRASKEIIKKYLNNKGYYNSKVTANTIFKRKKAKTTYSIQEGERYKIKELTYTINDPSLEAIFLSDSSNAKININVPFDVNKLKEERLRIERLFKNFGYYKFSREYVVFEVDTFASTHSANVNLLIRNPVKTIQNSDSLIELKHKIYRINTVTVRMDFDVKQQGFGDTTLLDGMTFVDLEGEKFNKKAISRITYIRPGESYSLKQQEQTYRNLSGLKVFSYVSIQYQEDDFSNEDVLNVTIDLKPRKKKSLTIETEGTNNGGNLGLNGTVNFQNNNAFKGAEILDIRFSGGVESQTILTDNNEQRVLGDFLPFNTLEFGPELSLEVPRFLLPINADRFSPRGNPRTTFNASYNLQERPDYRRDVTKVFIAYSWNESPTKTHVIQPFDLSYIKLDPSEEFTQVLNNIQNPFLRNSYTDHLISAAKYSFIYNNKTSSSLRNSIFFRGNIESAGNLLSIFTKDNVIARDSMFNEIDDSTFTEIFGIRYAQYIRADIDFRFYQNFNLNKLVYRFTAGIGIPYGNSVALPFEKSFYAGGANGIRAWRARELGPGNLPDSTEQNIDQIGNMKIEINLEYRFPITNIIEGAAFVDAGNIWNYRQKDSRTETLFGFNRLWDGSAVGFGVGLRLDFTFFILRLDAATRLKDPSLVNPNLISPQWRQTNLNLGIGYPF